MTRRDELKRLWPEGSLPPPGYADRHEWAEAQLAHGLMQTFCDRCKRWYFPQEQHAHDRATDREETSR